MRRLFFVCTISLFFLSVQAFTEERIPRLETYVTSDQVESYFSTPENRLKTLQVYQNIGITKVFLESLRSGHQASLDSLREARDFLRDHGIEVSGGIATTAGENFCEPSSSPTFWLNYQHPKTQNAISEHIRKVAPLFDEIIVDDFLATDDESSLSLRAKGNRRWSDYRLELMADFAERFIVKPAREANPKIQLIEKIPQWYDRFHLFGYNVEAAPRLFDRVWVGTETRNPDTARFGYTMPTEGYINYRWLASIAGEKIGGGWFDFGDCASGPYLMQAYQSVLAGAKELVLFESGTLIQGSTCLEPFLKRRDALYSLGKILGNRIPQGMYAYKPPNSDASDEQGAANLYIFDYLATLGLAPLPVSQVPDDVRVLFLPRQAADDPEIVAKCNGWQKKGVKLIVTPDFLARVNNPSLPSISDRSSLPPFSSRQMESGTIWIFNLETFRHDEFAPGKELLLPPRPLKVCEWPGEVVNPIRKEVLSAFGLELDAPNNIGVCLYDDGLLVLANFNDVPAQCVVQNLNNPNSIYHPNKIFLHDEKTQFEENKNNCIVTLSPWEIAVLNR